MGARGTVRVIVIALAALGGPRFTSPAWAQASCTAEMNRQDAALQRFGSQTGRDVNAFAGDDAARAAFGDELVDGVKDSFERAKNVVNGDATAGLYDEFKDAWQEYQDYVKSLPTMSEILGRASACFKSRGSDCMKELREYNENSSDLLEKSAEASKEWIDSLENDSITNAAERVERARDVMEKVAGNASNLASGAISGAMQNCMNDLQARAQAAGSSEPVDLRTPAQTANTGGNAGGGSAGGSGGGQAAGAASGGGSGVGTAVGIGAAAVGAGVGAYYVNDYYKSQKCVPYETEADSKVNSLINATNNLAVCTTQSCYNSRIGSVNSAMTSLNNTLGEWCSCLGGVGKELSASDKAAVVDALSSMRSLGIGTGTLPACFR